MFFSERQTSLQVYCDIVGLYKNFLKKRGEKKGRMSKMDFPKLAQLLMIPEQIARMGNGDLLSTAWGEETLKSFIDVKSLTNWGRHAVENVFNHIAIVLTSEVCDGQRTLVYLFLLAEKRIC